MADDSMLINAFGGLFQRMVKAIEYQKISSFHKVDCESLKGLTIHDWQKIEKQV